MSSRIILAQWNSLAVFMIGNISISVCFLQAMIQHNNFDPLFLNYAENCVIRNSISKTLPSAQPMTDLCVRAIPCVVPSVQRLTLTIFTPNVRNVFINRPDSLRKTIYSRKYEILATSVSSKRKCFTCSLFCDNISLVQKNN